MKRLFNKTRLSAFGVAICIIMCIFLYGCGSTQNAQTSTSKTNAAQLNVTGSKTEIVSEVVKVTDKNGEVVTNKNGESKTQIVTKSVLVDNKTTINNNKTATTKKKSSTTKKKTITTKHHTSKTSAETQKTYTTDTYIALANNATSVKGTNKSNVNIKGNVVTIVNKGVYELSGTLSNGQLVIDLANGSSSYEKQDDDKVVLVLNNMRIENSSGFAVNVECAKTTVFNSVKGTTNVFKDAGEKNVKAWACIYSDDNLTFNGEGTINVYGNTNNGIYSKNDVKLNGGTLNIVGKQNGVRGDDEVTVKDGNISITSENGDCIKATSAKVTSGALDKTIGFVNIEGGKLSLKAGDDALQAVSLINISKSASVTVVYKGKVTGDSGKKCKTGYIDSTGTVYDGEVIGKDDIL